jgi:hypothetical protein
MRKTSITNGILLWKLFLLIWGLLGAACTSLSSKKQDHKYIEVISDAERLSKDGKFFITSGGDSLSGGKLRSSEQVHSGKYSVLLSDKKIYAMNWMDTMAYQNTYYELSVWRKSKYHKGYIVIEGNKHSYYAASGKAVEVDDNGWEKVVLMATVPPTIIEHGIKAYLWSAGPDSVFFDDFIIRRYSHKIYPQYDSGTINIELNTDALQKLQRKRKQAFELGILQTSGDDWVKGILFTDKDVMKAKLRLKGDRLDHLTGEKWSFRVKLKKNSAWKRLRVFSLHTPEARNFQYEWIIHKMLDAKDILTTRYGFVPLQLNRKSLGLYAWEEHFTKQLMEFHKRREGVILKFSEDAYWQWDHLVQKNKNIAYVDYFAASRIQTFETKRVLKDSSLYHAFTEGAKLMKQHQYGTLNPSEIFNTDQLAMFFAFIDLTQASHGSMWHNLRFYFNPLIEKLEIIAYDGSLNEKDVHWNMFDYALYRADRLYDYREYNVMKKYVFEDSVFVQKYLSALEEVSKKSFVDSITGLLSEDVKRIGLLVRQEFPDYVFDNEYFQKRAEFIRNTLPELRKYASTHTFSLSKHRMLRKPLKKHLPEGLFRYLVNAYIQSDFNGELTFLVQNFLPEKIALVGLGNNIERPEIKLKELPITAYRYGQKPQVMFQQRMNKPKYLFFKVENRDSVYTVEIMPWRLPEGLTSRQKLLRKSNLDDYSDFIRIEGNEIIFSGKHQIHIPVVIPENYQVRFEEGTSLDFVNGAFFLSFSPVKVKGTKDKPVLLSSPDHSAKGFSILQPYGKCSIENLIFKGFDAFAYEKWNLSGAFTIYEGDGVEINNVQFVDNQCEDALNLVRSSFKISDCTFEHTWGDAFDADFCTGHITDSRFVNIGNDAIDYSGSEITVSHCEIYQANDKGISGGEESHLKIEDCTIESANIGIASKDLSQLEVVNTQIASCRYGLVLLQKKPEYGPATIRISGSKIENTPEEYLIEKGSELILDGRLIFGLEKKLAKKFY